MDEEFIDRMVQMIKSNQQELQQLAIFLFTNNTQDYQDYWNLRTKFSESFILPRNYEEIFDQLFHNVDMSTVDEVIKKNKEVYLEKENGFNGYKIGRLEVIKRTCRFGTKQEQKKKETV